MTKALIKQIKQTLKNHSTLSLACLYPADGDYAWGTSDKNSKNTLKVVNSILSEIPDEAWPEQMEDEEEQDCNVIKSGNWRIYLDYVNGVKSANLVYSGDDHTAWVVKDEKKNKFVDFDIGGS